ncbi:MAG: hypothetical protein GY884_24355, partial [Proteobacteria bacterium]|nr:hypothetical protein [Pseudomonadota bacterium]
QGFEEGDAFLPVQVVRGWEGPVFDAVTQVVVADDYSNNVYQDVYARRADGSMWGWASATGTTVPSPYLLDGVAVDRVWRIGTRLGCPTIIREDGIVLSPTNSQCSANLDPIAAICP